MDKLFDTHAHLCDAAFDSDRGEVLRHARDKGVELIAEISCGPDEWRNALNFAASGGEKIIASVGFHPGNSSAFSPAALAEFKKMAALPQVRAVGEIGLDYYWPDNPAERQLEMLEALVSIANEVQKPVILHCRSGKKGENAYEDLLRVIGSGLCIGGDCRFKGILHCFSGAKEDAVKAVDMGFALGVNGTVTYPKNGQLRDIFKYIGKDSLVLETDCPYLPPQSIRGKRNDPSFLPEIAAGLAAALLLNYQETVSAVYQNSLEVFRLI